MLNVLINKSFCSGDTVSGAPEGPCVVTPETSVQKEFQKVRELVLLELGEDERCRNEDTYLVLKVLRHFTNAYIPYQDFTKLPSLETITRCRRLIQNKEGRFKPTNPEVLARRSKREYAIREMLRV